MTSRFGAHAARRAAALSVFAWMTGCTDDSVGNPFNATEGSSSGGATDTGGDDPAVVTTQDGSSTGEPGTSTGMVTTVADGDTGSSGGSTMAIADSGDDSSEGSGPGSTGDASTGEASTGDGESSSSDDGGMSGIPCPVDTIDTMPFSISDSTVGQQSEFGSGCGGHGAPEMAYVLTAPADGFYVFDTFGSNYDTVLHVLDGECGGPVLACNDDDDQQPPDSQVSVSLTAGQVVTVVADGFGLAGGNFTLTGALFAGTCPNGDLGSTVPQTFTGSTATVDNTFFGTCGGNTANDEAFTFTAPAAGVYQIDTEGSAYDTLLYVLDGDCSGPQIGCNDDTAGMSHSRINVNLANGQTIVIVVDGAGIASGDFTLNILEATDSGNCCVTHATTGCDDPAVEACVCAADGFCCSVSWDGLCQSAAINNCNAICP
jgi:hypothetical protein